MPIATPARATEKTMTNAALVFGSEPRDDADGRVGLEKEPEERMQTVHEA